MLRAYACVVVSSSQLFLRCSENEALAFILTKPQQAAHACRMLKLSYNLVQIDNVSS